MSKIKSTVTNPNLMHKGIVTNPVMAVITLQNELSQNPHRYDSKELKSILTDILDSFDRMMSNSSSNNKNSSAARQYADHYNWVEEKINQLK